MQNDLDECDVIEAIDRNCRRWQPLIEEPPHDEVGVYNHVQHLKWLLPLAEVLQSRSALDDLHTRVHHAVIELRRQPNSSNRTEYFSFYAVEEKRFKLSHTLDSLKPSYETVKVGSADAVMQTLFRLLASSGNDTINREE